jgi:hypothetical protein
MPAEQRAIEPPAKPATARLDDVALWLALLVPLHAAGINTIVGYIVAHHACNVNKKGALLIVPIVDLTLAIGSGALAAMMRAKYHRAEDNHPFDGRRLFMANIALLVSGLCTLLILGGLLATIVVSPCD